MHSKLVCKYKLDIPYGAVQRNQVYQRWIKFVVLNFYYNLQGTLKILFNHFSITLSEEDSRSGRSMAYCLNTFIDHNFKKCT